MPYGISNFLVTLRNALAWKAVIAPEKNLTSQRQVHAVKQYQHSGAGQGWETWWWPAEPCHLQPPAQTTCPWHSHALAGRAFLLELDCARGRKLGTAHPCFVSARRAADTVSAKLSPESTRVTCHGAEAIPQPPQTAKGFLPFN